MANDPVTLVAELERLHQRQADLRAYEIDLAERGENDPASDTWKTAAIVAASAEADFEAALIRNYSTIARVLREAAEGPRYFLSTDNDSHWYLVPVVKAAEWDEWSAIPEDDERAWEAPEFAMPIGGAPRLVTFASPEIDGRPLPAPPSETTP